MRPATSHRLRQLVHDNYQQIAKQFSITRQQSFWPELQDIIRQLPINGSVLDVGCGNGRLLDELKKRPLDSYTGLDLSSNLIDLAKQRYPAKNLPFPVAWQTGDLLATALEQKFNFIFCIAALHHLPGHKLRQVAVRQLAAWLKPDGYLIISVWDLWRQPKHWWRLLRSVIRAPFSRLDSGDLLFHWGNQKATNTQRYYHALTGREFKKLIVTANLKIIDYRRDGLNYYIVAKTNS